MPRNSASIKDPTPPKEIESDIPKTRDELRHEALNGFLQLIQFGCITFGSFADAGSIGLHGESMVNEVVELAKNNSKVASKVDLLIEVGPYAGFVAAAIPFVAQLLVNHGIFKAEQFANVGVVSPEILEAQMKTEMTKRAMQALEAQRAAEMELQKMQEEMANSVNGQGKDGE